MARRARDKRSDVLIPSQITKAVSDNTSGLNAVKIVLAADRLESGPLTEFTEIISGVKESTPVMIPHRRPRNYRTLPNLPRQEDENARAVRLANEHCDRIAVRVDEVDERYAYSWLQSALVFCEWRSGRFPGARAWRDRDLRDPVDVEGYLDAVRVLNTGIHALDRQPMGLAAPVLNATPAATPEELELAKRPRPSLVAELVSLRPELADGRKHLMGFTREKLARMVNEARAAFAAAEASERRRA